MWLFMAASHGVLVVDFGAQYAQLIARRVREAKVYSEIVPSSITAAEVRAKNPSAIVLSGGPSSVYAENAPKVDEGIFALGIPHIGSETAYELAVHFGTIDYIVSPAETEECGYPQILPC